MQRLHIILTAQAGHLGIADRRQSLAGPSLQLVGGTAAVSVSGDTCCHSFSPADLQPVCHELQHLLAAAGLPAELVQPDWPRPVPAGERLVSAALQLAASDATAMLRFVLAYCLAVDGAYCSTLLQRLVAGDRDLFAFVHCHRLEPWPVARYAEALGLPLRKFNQLFQDKFGVSAKHWLLARRLEHAHQLLQTTSKKVIEVALESGFCSHAHFCDSFRRHFRCSPSEVRRDLPIPYPAALAAPFSAMSR